VEQATIGQAFRDVCWRNQNPVHRRRPVVRAQHHRQALRHDDGGLLLRDADPESGTIDVGIGWVQPRLTTVAKGGAADLAGLMTGDLITAVDGVSVAEFANGSIMQLIAQRPAGAKAVLTVVRGTEQRSIAVTVRGAK
jgi:S1-C subfamily serine protease